MNASPTEFGLIASGRYVPRLRLERSEVFALHRWMAPGLRGLAKGRRSIANWDEDSVTMAVEAARGLLGAAPALPAIDQFTLASTTLPFADRLNAGIAASALGLPPGALARDVCSSMRSATTELLAALRGASGNHLIVASELRTPRPASSQEMIVGHGAAAVLVGQGTPVATLVAAHSVQADFVDHFRSTGQAHDYGWEERWVRDEGYMKIALGAARASLAAAGVTAREIAHFVLPAPIAKVNEALAKKLDIDPAAVVPTNAESVGDLGCAQPLAMLDVALRRAGAGELILLMGFGSGCDALVLRRTAAPCTGPVPDAGAAETSYLKYLAFTGLLEPEWGMRAEYDAKTALSAAWRGEKRVARFEGGRCTHCGTVQFPATRVCVNPDCRREGAMTAVSLADTPARVLSHTSDFLAYTPHPPFQFGHIDFEGGGRVLMEFTDTGVDELAVGAPVRMVYRIKEIDAKRGYRRYFWKATPVRQPA